MRWLQQSFAVPFIGIAASLCCRLCCGSMLSRVGGLTRRSQPSPFPRPAAQLRLNPPSIRSCRKFASSSAVLPPSFSVPKISQDHKRAQKEFAARINDALAREPIFSWPYFEVACRLGVVEADVFSQILSVTENQVPERVTFAYDQMVRQKFAITPAVYNLALVAFARTGKIDRMRQILDELQAKSIVIAPSTHNDLLLHLTKAGKLDDAVNVLGALMKANVLPNITFSNMLLEALIAAKRDSMVMPVLRLLRPLGRRALLEAANFTLQLYLRSENWERAPDVLFELDAMQIPPDEQLLNVMLEVTLSNRRLPQALQILRRIRNLNMKPRPNTLQKLLTALTRQSDFASVTEIVLQMPSWCMVPTPGQYLRAFTSQIPTQPRQSLALLELMLPSGVVPIAGHVARLLREFIKKNLTVEARKVIELMLQPQNRKAINSSHACALLEVIGQSPPQWQQALAVSVDNVDLHSLLDQQSSAKPI